MPTQTHSDKAKETLRLMDADPSSFEATPVVWTKELRTVTVEVNCPTCEGRGRAYVSKEEGREPLTRGKAYKIANAEALAAVRAERPDEDESLQDSRAFQRTNVSKWLEARGYAEDACPTCPPRRKHGNLYGTGKAKAREKRLVTVGRYVWPEGTRFTSRFSGHSGTTRSNHVCDLCAKGINKSGRVAVVGRTSAGSPVGMLVGEDCARKILGVAWRLKAGHFIADNLEPEPAEEAAAA